MRILERPWMQLWNRSCYSRDSNKVEKRESAAVSGFIYYCFILKSKILYSLLFSSFSSIFISVSFFLSLRAAFIDFSATLIHDCPFTPSLLSLFFFLSQSSPLTLPSLSSLHCLLFTLLPSLSSLHSPSFTLFPSLPSLSFLHSPPFTLLPSLYYPTNTLSPPIPLQAALR